MSRAPQAADVRPAALEPHHGTPRAGRFALFAALLYLLVSFGYFALPVVSRFGSELIGSGTDPQLFAWSLAWWPHALGASENPIVSHALWAPVGSDLAWATAVPGLALLLAPVTIPAGPIAAYNLAELLLPAAAAFGAYLLCWQLTRRFWPALAGGYLFGFSSYMLGQELGHLQLTSVFPVPLVALLVLRFLRRELGVRGLVACAGPLLALQFSFGTEVFFTLSLALLVSLLLAALLEPALRERLRAIVLPLVGSYALCALLVSPLLYYALSDFQSEAITPSAGSGADLVNFAFPATLTFVGGNLAAHFDPAALADPSEVGEYLGLPLLAIAALYLWRRRHAADGRFLAAALALAALFSLGSELRVRMHALFPLPWRAVAGLPVFDNVIASRLALYVSLLAAVIFALWASAARRHPRGRALLALLTLLALIPNLRLSIWHQLPEQPRFFTTALERECLGAGKTVLLLPPPSRNEGLLWQAEDGFRYGLADGGLDAQLPANMPDQTVARLLVNNKTPPGRARGVLAFTRAAGVAAIVVDDPGGPHWRSVLDPALRGRHLGGVTVYALARLGPDCSSSAAHP